MLYEVNNDKPTRYMHLPTIPYLSIRKQEMEDYPWRDWVVTIDGNDANFLFDGKSFYVDFSDGEKQEEQMKALTEACDEMIAREVPEVDILTGKPSKAQISEMTVARAELVAKLSNEFMEGKAINYRHRVEHIIKYTEDGKLKKVSDLVNKLI
jgi:hypothetical protein